MPQTFTWFPDASVKKAMKPRVRIAKFGDGYEQRTRDGINHAAEVWTLTFSGANTEINAVDAFLESHGGADSFVWTTPKGKTGRFICRSWGFSRNKGAASSISCDFEQVFDV